MVLAQQHPHHQQQHQHQHQQQQAPRSMVHVTRICVVGTLETDLFRRIDEVAAAVVKKTEGGMGVTMTTGGNNVNEEPYVCEAWDKVLPKRIASSSGSMVKKDVDCVTVTESVSVEERLRRKFEDAKKNGSIILLSDDDDNDDDDDGD